MIITYSKTVYHKYDIDLDKLVNHIIFVNLHNPNVDYFDDLSNNLSYYLYDIGFDDVCYLTEKETEYIKTKILYKLKKREIDNLKYSPEFIAFVKYVWFNSESILKSDYVYDPKYVNGLDLTNVEYNSELLNICGMKYINSIKKLLYEIILYNNKRGM